MNNWPSQSQVTEYYGDPRGRSGQASGVWESANLVFVPVPWRMVTAWDGRPVNRVRVHRKCAESLARVFGGIWAAADHQQAVIEQWGCHKFGGAYNFRLMRGGSRLSMHSYGCAIDLDPERNQMGDRNPYFANVPEVRKAFDAEGWEHGIGWSTPDAQHWQAART